MLFVEVVADGGGIVGDVEDGTVETAVGVRVDGGVGGDTTVVVVWAAITGEVGNSSRV